jgi:hypothetical protein
MNGRLEYARRVKRTVLVTVASAVVLVCFWSFGGISFAGTSASANQYQYDEYHGKVTICHKGKVTIRVSLNAVQKHLEHGDTLGPCPPS